MVARLSPSQSIHRIFNYNENKVNKGVAECIGAANYPVDHDQMNIQMKLNRLLKQIEMTTKGKLNSLHVSLNFDVSETHLSREKLMDIADTYMREIGFGKQPYLVYQHFDAGHPHIHIVTTNIDPNGKRISLNRLANRKSEPARKMIEETFQLVKAEGRSQEMYRLEPLPAERVSYGKSQTKLAIQNVLSHVVDKYKFASLPEFNALLKLYNIEADRGVEGSRVQQHNGLLYHILDASGKPVGVPIKASSFYKKPTLSNLEKMFKPNELDRMPHKPRIRNAIDMAFKGKVESVQSLTESLKKLGIDTVLRRSESGLIYGITYIDHKTKCVFNGSELGKKYSAKEIQERCGQALGNQPITGSKLAEKPKTGIQKSAHTNRPAPTHFTRDNSHSTLLGDLADDLFTAEQVSGFVPIELRKKRRKKRRDNPSKNI